MEIQAGSIVYGQLLFRGSFLECNSRKHEALRNRNCHGKLNQYFQLIIRDHSLFKGEVSTRILHPVSLVVSDGGGGGGGGIGQGLGRGKVII